MDAQVKKAIDRLHSVSDSTLFAFRDAIVEELCALTDSEIAYFYATDLTAEHLTLLGYSKGVMNNCQISERPAWYKVAETGLWGDAIREGKAVITNDYETTQRPSKHGIPEGHVPVYRHMNLPVYADGRIVALVGVGNKAAPYVIEDADRVEQLMNAIWVEFQEALFAATW